MANFTMAPNEVVESEPIYNNVITQSESMKKEFLNLAATPIKRYTLHFDVLTTAEKDAFLTHWNATGLGGYASFSWTSVPAHVNGGVNLTGRWVEGSLSITGVSHNYWKIQVTFEKAI
jgi:hypothetical protein